MDLSTTRDGVPHLRISWVFLIHRTLACLLLSIMLGCAEPTRSVTAQPDLDVRSELLSILALGGPECSQLSQFYEKYEIVPILIDVVKDKDVSWYRALRKRPHYEETADDQSIRRETWDKVFRIFDRFADERGYRFQIQAYQDMSEPYIVRMNALRHFWNANLPEVRDLFAQILESHVRRKAYSGDGLLVLQYVRQSIRFRPNRLWDVHMKKAVEDYLVFLKEYMTENPKFDEPPTLDTTIQLVRQAIEKLDRPE
jgi:hypothetical protein